jgi:hypothetical protein
LLSIFFSIHSNTKLVEGLTDSCSTSTVASSDENTYDWIPFEQPDLPSESIIKLLKQKYNKDFDYFRTHFLVTCSECLYYYKFGKFPYNDNLIRPSYKHMQALDAENTQSFQDWKNSYYADAQQNIPMRALVLASISGTPGRELQGIKETDFANKLYQGKLSLDENTIVGCTFDKKPYIKINGAINTDKSDTDIYEAINKVYDIEFLESTGAGCTKGRQLCTESNILECPFKFQDELKNSRMSNIMAQYWDMDDKQELQFSSGCYTNESCKEKVNA